MLCPCHFVAAWSVSALSCPSAPWTSALHLLLRLYQAFLSDWTSSRAFCLCLISAMTCDFWPTAHCWSCHQNQLSPKNSLKAGLKNAERSFVGSMRQKEKETSLMKKLHLSPCKKGLVLMTDNVPISVGAPKPITIGHVRHFGVCPTSRRHPKAAQTTKRQTTIHLYRQAENQFDGL